LSRGLTDHQLIGVVFHLFSLYRYEINLEALHVYNKKLTAKTPRHKAGFGRKPS
jgi:hypothetical protein